MKIDEFLSDYDFGASYDIHISARRLRLCMTTFMAGLQRSVDKSHLETLRTGKLVSPSRAAASLSQRLQGTGFVMLAEVPSEELLMGIAGRFWRPDGGRCLDLRVGDFVEFARLGYAKVAWNFSLRADSSGETVLSTETRTKCFGPAARWKFGIYWFLIYPFSGLIRKAILNRVKRTRNQLRRSSTPAMSNYQ
jgi:hypothetical protein